MVIPSASEEKKQDRNIAKNKKEGSENDGDNGENAAKISVRWYYFVVIEIHVYQYCKSIINNQHELTY